jgi:HSP20 family protein
MRKAEFRIEVIDDTLIVSGEKHFERETTEGRYRLLQCAYGSFRRMIALPTRVLADRADARYADGVLRIELPKAAPGAPESHTIEIR